MYKSVSVLLHAPTEPYLPVLIAGDNHAICGLITWMLICHHTHTTVDIKDSLHSILKIHLCLINGM